MGTLCDLNDTHSPWTYQRRDNTDSHLRKSSAVEHMSGIATENGEDD
jgi:hypothetical protein